VLQAQVPVQAGGVMLLDHEAAPVGVGAGLAGGLRGGLEVALGSVATELGGVLGPRHATLMMANLRR